MAGKPKSPLAAGAFIRSLQLRRDMVESFDEYPFSIPSLRQLEELALHPKVTFFVGENGSGKSTLIEAIAVAAGFNAEGGSKSFQFSTRSAAPEVESRLSKALRLVRGMRREKNGFFLRAESFFNAATYLDGLGPEVLAAYGGTSLHEQSHGESFLALANHRFKPGGLYLLDEPEAALSPSRQLTLLSIIHRLVEKGGSQFLIATHSPILMAFPIATIYHLSADGINSVAYEETEHYKITHDFLLSRARFFKHLFNTADSDGDDDDE